MRDEKIPNGYKGCEKNNKTKQNKRIPLDR